MTSEHLSALLQAASAKTDDEGWQHPAEGRSMTLHLAHDGATLSISRICAARVTGKLVYTKSSQGELYVVSLDDLFAGSVEGPREVGRKAGFA
ncbi:MAG TPA: hypothetical protein VIV60_33135 [Polyangiaceae bacterium]